MARSAPAAPNAELPERPARADAEALRGEVLAVDADMFLPNGAMLSMLDIEFVPGELVTAQARLRKYLDEIVAEHGATVPLVHQISDALKAMQAGKRIDGVATLKWRPFAKRPFRWDDDDDEGDPNFEFVSFAVLRPRSVEEWCTLALAALASSASPNLARKVGRCGLQSCGIYFARPYARGDQPLQWCCPSHGSQHRQKTSRQRRQSKTDSRPRRRKKTLTTKTRAVIYGRYSTDMQSKDSIADQGRECERLAERNDFQIVARFGDEAISGGTDKRPGYQAMLAAARKHEFDVIIAEDLKRLWREQAEQWRAIKELLDLEIFIVTASGIDSRQAGFDLIAAVMGAAGELDRKETAYRTRRGLEGVARQSRHAGGRPYGYLPAGSEKKRAAGPVSGTGQMEIFPEQARVVLRIFDAYAGGMSARAIAELLNSEGVPSPGSFWNRTSRRKSAWLASAIAGTPSAGTGLLNNSLYIGKYTWGREKWKRGNADSSVRKRSAVDPAQWVTHDVERLRIIPQELWDRVKARQAARSTAIGVHIAAGIERVRSRPGRPSRYVLSGLVYCPMCGSSYIIADHYRHACSTHHNGGGSACINTARYSYAEAEQELFTGLRAFMERPEIVADLRKHVVDVLRERGEADDARRKGQDNRGQIAQLEAERDNLVAAIASGVLSDAIRAKLAATEAALERLRREAEPMAVRKAERILPGLH